MRIYLKIAAQGITIPYEHQTLLTGVIHKWIGYNNEHGKVSLYSFSQLEGAKATPKGLKFEKDSLFFISSFKEELLKKILKGVQQDASMFHGLNVKELIIEEDPDFSNRERFYAASPIFIKRSFDGRVDHILYTDSRANVFLKETLETKMKIVGLKDDDLKIVFDLNYPKAGTKKITYNGVDNKANWCSVLIKGKPETKLFAWNVGLGNSTGIGFGAIK
ncbi:MAG: CRISPR-associated endoribonuclease Cas6 [Bacteroidetes bacterium HGW-Bacteroidetes-1]|jgi:CRISPR-associated endoribonuclease Cas6|nr:MAG: CRISPR-associated endoribonuclease Cas6 [Bacteroidetes bacterium HGW-Bacteroidetes-1]